MAITNSTGTIGIIIDAITTNITGDPFLTMIFIFLIAITLFAILRVPLELSSILVVPLAIIMMVYSKQFVAIGGALLIYLGLIFAKRFFIK